MPIAQTSLRWAKGVSYHAYEGIAVNLDELERLVKGPWRYRRHDPQEPWPAHLRAEHT